MESKIAYVEAFDNGGFSQDRYTVNVELVDESRFLVTSDRYSAIWDVSENDWIDGASLTDEDEHIGKEIDWYDLPDELKHTIENYFNT